MLLGLVNEIHFQEVEGTKGKKKNLIALQSETRKLKGKKKKFRIKKIRKISNLVIISF